jgi:hypothetical protein
MVAPRYLQDLYSFPMPFRCNLLTVISGPRGLMPSPLLRPAQYGGRAGIPAGYAGRESALQNSPTSKVRTVQPGR